MRHITHNVSPGDVCNSRELANFFTTSTMKATNSKCVVETLVKGNYAGPTVTITYSECCGWGGCGLVVGTRAWRLLITEVLGKLDL